jgi:hypothetical protein
MESSSLSYRAVPAGTPTHVVALAYVGFAGLGGFVLSTFLLLIGEPDRNPVHEPFSYYYVHGHHGWLLTVGLLALGFAALALSVGVTHYVHSRAGPRGLAIFGLAVIIAGLFPADPWWPWEQLPSGAAAVHGMAALGGMAVFAGTAIPLMLSLRNEARWDRVGGYFTVTAVAGALGIIGCVVSATAHWQPQFLGLAERVAIGAGVAWLGLIAAGLLRSSVMSSHASNPAN